MPRVHLSKNGIPSLRKGEVLGGLVSGRAQLLAQLFRRVVREPEDGAEEILVQDGRAEKTVQLKPLDRVPHQRQDVPIAGKHRAGHAAVTRRKEGELAGPE